MSERATLSACRIGVSIRCAVCGHTKKPIGRAEPLGAYYCTNECEGYRQQPYPGSLWPGESEADFGYPVSVDGTTDAAHPSHQWGTLACLACDCGSRHQAALEPCTRSLVR